MFDAKVQIRQAVTQAMRAVVAELRDAQAMGGAVGRQLVEQVGRVDADQNKGTFAAQAQPGGGAWKPLNPEYAKRKRKAVGARKILVWSGAMRGSATTAKGQGRIARISGKMLELGTSHRLAKKHQFGQRGVEYVQPHHRALGVAGDGFRILGKSGKTRGQVRGFARRVNLPARPFIGKSAEQAAAIKQAIGRVVAERVERASRGRLRAARLGAARSAGRLIVVER